MHIPAGTIATAYGRRAVHPPEPMVDVRLTPDELRGVVRQLDLDAELAQAAGDMARADRLAGRAAALRAVRQQQPARASTHSAQEPHHG